MSVDWWQRPRTVSVLVDNDGWILPWAERLVHEIGQNGDACALIRAAPDLPRGDVALFLGCTSVVASELLARHRVNLVVHESPLPEGRGFAPMTWQVLEGKHTIAVCLIEAAAEPDRGNILLRDEIRLEGTEVCAELRELQGEKTLALCHCYLNAETPPPASPQRGEGSFYRRRTPKDSEIDPGRTIAEQFDLLRVVDNDRYPAFFTHRGRRYRLAITPMDDDE